MFNNNDIVLLIKRAAADVINAQKPVDILYGTVESRSPISIRIDQKNLLVQGQLILSRNVSNFSVELTEAQLGTRTFQVNNALVEGEKVILIRFQGGQKYLVLDRVV